jgi:magnesium transporter
MNFVLTKEYLAEIQNAIESKNSEFLLSRMENLQPQDISEIIAEIEEEESKYILELLDVETAADIVANMESESRPNFLQQFSPAIISKWLDRLDSDDIVDILNDLPLKLREQILAVFPTPETATLVKEMLHYDADCAGGLMAKELIKVNLNRTVAQCIEEIKRQAEEVEKILMIYVIDDEQKLLGRVSAKKIIISDSDMLIKNIYDDDIQTVYTYESADHVASLIEKYDLEAIPVVDAGGRLLGRITVDDVIDVIKENAETDLQVIAGISEKIEEDDSVWRLTRARLPWLIIGMIGGISGAQIIGLFEEDLALIPAMSFFIPLITATGGNVGIQSSTIVVQALADTGGIRESVWSRLRKSVLVAILNGLALSILVFFVNFFLFPNTELVFVVSAALFSVVMIASFMGTVTPLIINRIGINPAFASGPFITTANDLIGLAVYFWVARLIL